MGAVQTEALLDKTQNEALMGAVQTEAIMDKTQTEAITKGADVNVDDEVELATAEGQQTFLYRCKPLIAGGVAGGVSRTAVAPLERLKILLQVQNSLQPKYNGMFQGLKYIWVNEGIPGFFKGNGANCARIIPNSAMKFYTYDEAARALLWIYKTQTGKEDAKITPLIRVEAGACAGLIAMSATYPMDMVRGRLTVQTDAATTRYRGMWHAASTIIKEEGARAVYKGWVPSAIGVIPYAGFNFAVFETLKDWHMKRSLITSPGEKPELGVWSSFWYGGAAGAVGQSVAYPLDVIRRRMQMGGWKNASSVLTADGQIKAPVQYAGMVDAFRQTVAHEGFRALYKGWFLNSVKVVPSISLTFATNEAMKKLLKVDSVPG